MKSFSLCSCRDSDPHRGEIRMRAESPSVERPPSFLNSLAISLRGAAQVWLWSVFDFKSINCIFNKMLSLLNSFQPFMISTLGQQWVCLMVYLCGGVLEKFPGLKIICLETGAS